MSKVPTLWNFYLLGEADTTQRNQWHKYYIRWWQAVKKDGQEWWGPESLNAVTEEDFLRRRAFLEQPWSRQRHSLVEKNLQCTWWRPDASFVKEVGHVNKQNSPKVNEVSLRKPITSFCMEWEGSVAPKAASKDKVIYLSECCGHNENQKAGLS